MLSNSFYDCCENEIERDSILDEAQKAFHDGHFSKAEELLTGKICTLFSSRYLDCRTSDFFYLLANTLEAQGKDQSHTFKLAEVLLSKEAQSGMSLMRSRCYCDMVPQK